MYDRLRSRAARLRGAGTTAKRVGHLISWQRGHELMAVMARRYGAWFAAWAMLACAWPGVVHAQASVAFFYGANPPLDELRAFEIAVVEPDHVADPRPHRRDAAIGASELFAYVSMGEIEPSRSYFRQVPAGVLKGENRAWGSSVVDQAHPAWPAFFVERIIAPLWERGYRGFFFDTLDSYQLIARTPEARAVQEAAMVATLRTLKARYPRIRLFFNRGFEILPQVREMVAVVGAESLFRGWDQGRKQYREVPQADREWLLGQLDTVRKVHRLPVVAIDYVAPGERDLARATARRILALGLIPWVANPELDTLGVGSREVLPRRVLVLTERPEGGNDFHVSTAQRFLGMPLNHLGFTYELLDPRSMALPEGTLRGRYAGIVTWLAPAGGQAESRLAAFLRRQVAEGVRVAVFNQFPVALDAVLARQLGLETFTAGIPQRVAITRRDPIIGHEFEPLPDRRGLAPIRAGQGSRVLLRVADAAGTGYDAAAITPWGGYVLAPFSFVSLPVRDQYRWVVNPLAFLRAALAPEELPVPDVTTEAGRRLLLVHIDGDGWASRAELPGAPYASEVMATELLERFRVPTTVSVIQGEIAADGLNRAQSPALEAVARRIFLLPNVEMASHSYSHPFNWDRTIAPELPGASAYHLDIPGYRFDLRREIPGSIAYINRTLAPPGRSAQVFLWTGDCVPPSDVLRLAYQNGLLNMNGGDTVITRSNPSWTEIAAQGIRKAGGYQVFAPNQNENVYTNNWTGPFYGFERVIETFEMTETPHRFKPINIYYHTYAASKVASLNALRKVYQYAMAQPVTPVYASEYIRKVLDFERMVIARDLASGDLVTRGDGSLRTLRVSATAALPDLKASTGLAGFAAGPNARYFTLTAAEARLAYPAGAAQTLPYLQEANGSIADFTRDADAFGFTLRSHLNPMFRLANAERCSVTVNGRAVRPVADRAPPVIGQTSQRHDLDPTAVGREPHQQVVRVRCLQ